MLKNSKKNEQSVSSDWNVFNEKLIEGVFCKEVKNVIKNNGILTEIFRPEWFEDENTIDQVFTILLQPGAISAWHLHTETKDRIAALSGTFKLVLFDDRENSPTRGLVNEFRLSEFRPATVVIPKGVWHGVQNLFHVPGIIINMVDKGYVYEDPDHWSLPFDDLQIPYTF